jgi:hypothetical protein
MHRDARWEPRGDERREGRDRGAATTRTPVIQTARGLCFRRNRTLFAMVPDGTHIREAKSIMPDGAIAWDPVG